jgi:hypothetical protein
MILASWRIIIYRIGVQPQVVDGFLVVIAEWLRAEILH